MKAIVLIDDQKHFDRRIAVLEEHPPENILYDMWKNIQHPWITKTEE